MSQTRPLRGLCTTVLTAADLPAAVRWYTDLLGIEPYFAMPTEGPPAYVEFRVGDDLDELGLLDRAYAPPATGPSTSTTYWAVDDAEAAYADLLERGASVHEAPTDRGPGFVTASVVDPFGNVLGVMQNAHWAAQHGDAPRDDAVVAP